jgi:hypothetical protein
VVIAQLPFNQISRGSRFAMTRRLIDNKHIVVTLKEILHCDTLFF